MRILHIDDDADFISVGSLILKKMGEFEIIPAPSGAVALELLSRETFDAIISDYQMPDMDGILLLKKVRLHGIGIPFIFFTGKSREEVVIEALNNGADYFIQKTGDVRAVYTELAHQLKRAFTHRKTEQSLAKSQEKYKRIIDTAQEGIWEIDRLYRTVYVNVHLCSLFGYSAEEMIGRKYADFMLPVDIPDHLEKMNERWQGVSRTYEQRFLHKNGQIIWTIVSAAPIYEGDTIVGSFGTLIDITERKQAELALFDSENLYRAIFENTGNASIIIEEDTLISLANTQWERLSGYRKDELEGKISWTIFVVPEDLIWMKDYHKIRRIDPDGAPWIYEFRFLMRNGEIRHIINHVAMIPGTKKSIASLLDITDRKEAEDAVRASEKKFRDLFTNIIDGIMLYEILNDGSAGKILEVNEVFSQWIHASGEEIRSSFPDQYMVSGRFHDRVQPLKSDTVCTFVCEFKGNLGNLIPIEVHLRVISYNNKLAGLAVLHDISERKRFEEERNTLLIQIEKNLGDLAILNDGIRNPLSVISTLIEEEAPGIGTRVSSQITHIDEMVRNLDIRWNESEKVLRFLRMHYQIGE